MSTSEYAFGSGNPTIDGFIQKPFPAYTVNGTEYNGIYSETREVNGTLWIVVNAMYQQQFGGFVQQAPAIGSSALVINPNGTIVRALAPSNASTPISWTFNSIPLVGNPLVFNVKDFGAVGDGTTDDTQAVQAAINTCAAAGGGVVFFPPGSYLRSTAWTFTASITLLGSGMGASSILSATTGDVATSVVQTSGADFPVISGLSFIGNGAPPASPPPNAPSVIVFNGGQSPRVSACYFTANTGRTIDFIGTDGGEVYASCRFYNTGYNGAGTSNALQTPAVYADSASTYVKVHDNDFDSVQYFSYQLLGTGCVGYANRHTNVHVAAVRVGMVSSTNEGNGSRIFGEYVNGVRAVSGSGGSGIYMEGANDTLAWGNHVEDADSDGFVDANMSQSARIGNLAKNCCQTTGDCGFQFNPHSGGTNVGMVYVGNVSYDDQGTPTQLNGMRVLGPGSMGAFSSVILGNSFNGFTGTVGSNPQRAINATDAILDDDTNVVAWNTGWLDREHLGAANVTVPASTTATGVGAPSNSVLGSVNIEKGVMGLNRAVRLSAYGTITVAASVTFLLSFGSALGNIINFAETTTHSAVSWQLEAWLNSADNNNGQHFSYTLYYNGAVVASGTGNLSVTTSTQDNPLTLQATTGSGDSVICMAYTYTRE